MVSVAIDMMGGDYGLQVTVPAWQACYQAHPQVQWILCGDQHLLDHALTQLSESIDPKRVVLRHSAECIAMDDVPSVVLRQKRQSSMHHAVQAVQSGEADVCVSAGNTGALMAVSYFILGTLPGIDRPAIAAPFPTLSAQHYTWVLDVGANLESTEHQLCQFGAMGSAFLSSVYGIESPRVALLNVGSESQKGNHAVKNASQILKQQSAIHYIGFLEGHDVYQHRADVMICSGFVGNILLKSGEGLAKLMSQTLKDSLNQTRWSKCLTWLNRSSFYHFKEKFDPNRYNGAAFLGLKGHVIKSHGGAGAQAFEAALHKAVKQTEHRSYQQMVEILDRLLLDIRTHLI